MRYVNRVIGKDGTERLYLRKAGLPSIRLFSPWGTAALQAEVEAILATATAKPTPTSLKAAVRAYELDSADFAGLAASTKYEYRLILKELETDFGALSVGTFSPAYLLQLRNIWAPRGHRAANVRLQVLKNVLWPSVIAGKLGDGDPFALIPHVRRPGESEEPHLIWPERVVFRVIEAAIQEGRFGVARGVAIGRYAGARRDDIVRLTKASRKAGRFSFISGKRRVLVDMPEDPALGAVLDGTPSKGLVLVQNLSGLPYSPDGFALELRKLVKSLARLKPEDGGIEDERYDVHGLRHTFGVEAAISGCTDAEGAALMGHGSPNSFATYRRQADRIRLSSNAAAKVAILREQTSNGDLQNQLQKICKTSPVRQAKARGRNAARSTR